MVASLFHGVLETESFPDRLVEGVLDTRKYPASIYGQCGSWPLPLFQTASPGSSFCAPAASANGTGGGCCYRTARDERLCSALCDRLGSACQAFGFKVAHLTVLPNSPAPIWEEPQCVLYGKKATILGPARITKKGALWSCYKKRTPPLVYAAERNKNATRPWVPPVTFSRVQYLDTFGASCPVDGGYACQPVPACLAVRKDRLRLMRCTCWGGVAAEGCQCPAEGEEYCVACHDGHEMDPIENRCIPQCTCPFPGGIAAKWPQCVIPSVKCATPYRNYTSCVGSADCGDKEVDPVVPQGSPPPDEQPDPPPGPWLPPVTRAPDAPLPEGCRDRARCPNIHFPCVAKGEPAWEDAHKGLV